MASGPSWNCASSPCGSNNRLRCGALGSGRPCTTGSEIFRTLPARNRLSAGEDIAQLIPPNPFFQITLAPLGTGQLPSAVAFQAVNEPPSSRHLPGGQLFQGKLSQCFTGQAAFSSHTGHDSFAALQIRAGDSEGQTSPHL